MKNERVVDVVEDLSRMLQELIRKHGVTHDEYRLATDVIIESITAGEQSLLFDIFLEAEATDVGNVDRVGSIEAIEGPFYLPGAPLLAGSSVTLPQRADEPGDPMIFSGRVTDDQQVPLEGVELDVWQADADGCYSGIHPDTPDWNLRGRFHTAEDGRFEMRTVVPPPYEIPKDGATGKVLRALGRHFYRPAHLHLKLRATGFDDLTSQLYFQGDSYLSSDAANAVRDGLVVDLTAPTGSAESYTARYDFVLARTQG